MLSLNSLELSPAQSIKISTSTCCRSPHFPAFQTFEKRHKIGVNPDEKSSGFT
jgi:hypothetical protein